MGSLVREKIPNHKGYLEAIESGEEGVAKQILSLVVIGASKKTSSWMRIMAAKGRSRKHHLSYHLSVQGLPQQNNTHGMMQTAEIYLLMVLEARGLRTRCWLPGFF